MNKEEVDKAMQVLKMLGSVRRGWGDLSSGEGEEGWYRKTLQLALFDTYRTDLRLRKKDIRVVGRFDVLMVRVPIVGDGFFLSGLTDLWYVRGDGIPLHTTLHKEHPSPTKVEVGALVEASLHYVGCMRAQECMPSLKEG